MKVVVAVSSDEGIANTLDALSALNFPNPELHFVHVINIYSYVTVDTSGYGGFDFQGEIMFALESEATKLLNDAKAEATKRGWPATKSVALRGDPGAEIISYSDGANADLIVLSAKAATPTQSFLSGSVARKVTLSAHQSILIARPGHTKPWQGAALFASDQSPYSRACATVLGKMAPKGIKSLKVLTAYEISDRDSMRALDREISPHSHQRLEQALKESGQDIISRMTALNAAATTDVVAADVHAAIAAEMEGPKARDLLILGSQGKGFFTRLRLGSTSLRQVETGDYPILLLRDRNFAK